MKLFRNPRTLRYFSWPVAFLTAFMMVYFPHFDKLAHIYAQNGLQMVDSAPLEINWGRVEELPSGQRVTPPLVAQAGRLSNHPVLIYEFVRNEIAYEPYRGARFGALGTLQRRKGNDTDQALLLAALLRAAWRNLDRGEPDLWVVRGHVRLTSRQARDFIGADTPQAIQTYLTQAGVPHRIEGNTATQRWTLLLEDHVWLRGDLEYGPLRGTRFVAGNDGIRTDLDPSFVLQEEVAEVPTPFELSGLDADAFVQQALSFLSVDEAEASASAVPEDYLLTQADSAAAVFRNFLEEEGLTVEEALTRRRPTVEKIDTLPESLPYSILGRPAVLKVADIEDFLAPMRHEVGLRIISESGETLAEANFASAALFENVLSVGFVSSDAAATTETYNQASLAQGALPVLGRVTLGESEIARASQAVGYGDPVRVEIALQGPGEGQPLPTADPAARRESLATRAGALFSVAALPSLNERTLPNYRERQQSLTTTLSRLSEDPSAGDPTRALAPTLDFTAQVLLSQSEQLIDLGALAAGHRVALAGQWALAGFEPVPAADGTFGAPQWRFALSEGALPIGPVVGESDARYAPTDSVQSALQLTRSAVLANGPFTVLGQAVEPVTAGRLMRDANSAGLAAAYAVTPENAEVLDAAGDRVPADSGNLAANLQARADAGASLLLADGRAAASPAEPAGALGLGWGALALDGPAWKTETLAADALAVLPHQAFSAQQTEALSGMIVRPGHLVAPSLGPVDGGGPALRLAQLAITGAETYEGASVAVARAYVAAVHPLAALCAPLAAPASPAEFAANGATAVVFLHALMEEFSRPEVLGMELLLARDGGDEETLAPGSVFNPAHWDRVTAKGLFNQIMTDFRFFAYDGGGGELARLDSKSDPDTPGEVREALWQLKSTPGFTGAFAGLDGYNGPLDLRLDGEVYERRSRTVSQTFTIDVTPPNVALKPFEGEVRGNVAVWGTVEDIHLTTYTVHLAEAGTQDWVLLNTGTREVGSGNLANWAAEAMRANGDYVLRLQAADAAGNLAEVQTPLTVRNDGLFPRVEFAAPAGDLLTGNTADLLVNALDNTLPEDSGIKSLRVDLDYTWARWNNISGQLDVEDRTENLLDFSAPFNPQLTKTFAKALDLRGKKGLSGRPLTIRVAAEDAFGNVTKDEREYNLAGSLYSVALSSSSVIDPARWTGNPAAHRIIVDILHGSGTPAVELLDQNGAPVGAVPYDFGPAPVQADTFLTKHIWRGEHASLPPGQSARQYQLRVSINGQSQIYPVLFLSGADPALDISEPLNTLLLKDKTPQVPINGYVFNPVFDAVGAPDGGEIGQIFPAERPYWLLSYKPHSAEPVIDSTETPYLMSVYGGFESSWKTIDYGFENRGDENTTATLGTWDISKLPVGTYDIRLLVTDGLRYATGFIPGYKVMHSATLPGEDTDDRTPGSLQLRQVDFSTDFEGISIEIAREYNSFRSTTKGDFGWGWQLEGLDLTLQKTSIVEPGLGDERIEAEITLPDGRTFTYANAPVQFDLIDEGDNSWGVERAFINRPYGQMLWLPGYTTPYDGLFGDGGNPFSQYDYNNEGHRVVQAYRQELIALRDNQGIALPDWHDGSSNPDGTLACLKLEDGSYLIYEWESGQLLRQDAGHGEIGQPAPVAVDYSYNDTENGTEVLIEDNLGRRITVERDSEGRISKITDPRGFFFLYTYNDKGELSEITDRNGNKRWLYYEDEDFPHYLTRMVVDRQDSADPNHGAPDSGDAEIAYDYDNDARLSTIETGAGDVAMEYEDNEAGGGTHTVVDEATGGRTEVEYDDAGRVTRQVDAAGVVTTYDYYPDDSDDYIAAPPGVLRSQTVGGVKTDFEYDLQPYQEQYYGIDGMAQNYFDFWSAHFQGRTARAPGYDDYNNGRMRPGYLTSQQVQPTNVKTPAVGPDGIDNGEKNSVLVRYNESKFNIGQAPDGTMPDGTGKVHFVSDPEGRDINLYYGRQEGGDTPVQKSARNEVGAVSGPGVETRNTYYNAGDFIGRIEQTVSQRGTETLSSVTYTYATGYANEGPFATLRTALEAAVPAAVRSAHLPSWPSGVWLEMQTVSTSNPSSGETISVTYSDAEGNNLASYDPQEESWTFTIADAEGRAVYSATSDGGPALSTTRTTYDGLGNVLVSESTGPNGASRTEYKYDDLGRQYQVIYDDGSATQTDYQTNSDGTRSKIVTDQDNNRTISVTDGSGRTVEERFEGAEGSVRVTRHFYDEFGRRYKTVSPRGLITETEFDAAGREIATHETYNGVTNTTRRGYDRFGRLAWAQTPLQARDGVRSTYLYRTDTDGSTPFAADDIASVAEPAYGQLVGLFHQDTDLVATNNLAADGSVVVAGTWELYEHDAEGRQVAVVKPASLSATIAANGSLTNEITAQVKTYTRYNDDGQAEAVIFNCVGCEGLVPGDYNQTPTQNVTFQFEYDESGSRTKAIYPSGIVKEWRDFLDAEGDLERVVETQASLATPPSEPTLSSLPWKTTYYNADGQRDRLVKANGDVTRYFYDDFRLDSETYTPSVAGAIAETIAYGYDARGRLDSLTHTVGDVVRTETRTFDRETGRLEYVEKDPAPIDYDYDQFGSLASISTLGHTVSYKYDFAGRLSEVLAPEASWRIEYNRAGLKKRVTNLTTGLVEERAYDALGRLELITHTAADGTVVFAADYVLGADGTRLGIVERRGENSAVWTYHYDRLGRLTLERREAGGQIVREVAYGYDADSNRILEDAADKPARHYFYEPGTQRLAAIREGATRATANTAVESFTYNANGQMLTRTNDRTGATTRYFWGRGETLIAAEIPGTDPLRVEYDYDTNNDLIGRHVFDENGQRLTSERYVVDRENPTGYSQTLAEIDATTGRVRALNTWADTLMARTKVEPTGAEERFVSADALGSLRATTDAQGYVQDTRDYAAFGELLSDDMKPGAQETAYAFTGQRLDGATELQHHRARWLTADIGKWASIDTYVDFPNNHISSYGYVGANPIGMFDPSGWFSLAEISISGVIQALLAYVIVPEITSFLLRTIVSASGIDASILYIPILDFLMEVMGFDILMDRFMEAVLGVEDWESVSEEQANEIILQISKAISLIVLAISGVDLLTSIVEFAISRSLGNLIELAQSIFYFIIAVVEAYEVFVGAPPPPLPGQEEEAGPSRSSSSSLSRSLIEVLARPLGAKSNQQYGLYVLLDSRNRNVKYVGIGVVNDRLASHKKTKPKHIGVTLFTTGSLTKAEARGLEQKLMDEFGGPKSVNKKTPLWNKIRSFTDRNGNAKNYRKAVTEELFKEALDRINRSGGKNPLRR
ncbi:MAG: RHS repeat-associated core domain-containing protein [Sumerlaeia bacterium]